MIQYSSINDAWGLGYKETFKNNNIKNINSSYNNLNNKNINSSDNNLNNKNINSSDNELIHTNINSSDNELIHTNINSSDNELIHTNINSSENNLNNKNINSSYNEKIVYEKQKFKNKNIKLDVDLPIESHLKNIHENINYKNDSLYENMDSCNFLEHIKECKNCKEQFLNIMEKSKNK